MTPSDGSPKQNSSDELAALRAIVEGTARHTGQEFFQSLVRHLAAAVGTGLAFVAEFAGGTTARTLALWFRDHVADNIEWDVTGTPCEEVVRGSLCHHPAGVRQRFPADRLLVDWGVESYMGVPLCDAQGRHIGHLAVLDERPMPAEPHKLFTLHIFAARAAAELERLHYEEALRAGEARYRVIVEYAADAFCLHDEDTRVLDVNRRACESLGYTRDELIGMKPSEFDPDVTPAIEEQIKRQLGAGEMIAFESRHRRKDGTIFPVEVRGKAFREGGRLFSVTMARDITARRKAEEALRQANARVELAVRSSNIGIWECDMPDGRIENARPTWINVWESLGYDATTMSTDSFSAFANYFHPDDLERVGRELQELLVSDGHEWKNEYRVRAKDGSTRWLLARGTVLRDPDGKPVRFIGATTDITERKRAEAALRESEGWFRFLANAMPQIVWTARPDGHNDYVNQRGEDYIGVSIGELHGDRWFLYVHPDDRDRTMARFLASVESGVDFDVEYRLRGADGRYRWFKSRCLPIRDDSGRVMKWVGTCTDMDDQKRTEEALRRAKESAEAANRAKDEFLANVSHEIRTPMNAILGMTELALDTPLTDDQRQYLTTVKSAADALLGVINDILDFAKIEADHLELDPADFSLSSVLGATLRALAVRAHKKGLELVCQQQPDVSDALIGDAGRLRQVLLNLVGNAIKFTDRGEVVVRVENAGPPAPVGGTTNPQAEPPAAGGEVNLRFAVTDTGVGIPPEKQAKVFQAFEQEDTSTTRKYGGTGLGLTIAARLVALMGGTITVDSVPGRGSTFAFTARFGLQPHPPGAIAAPPPVGLRDLPVLIVDDNATNRHILEEWLRAYSMEPTAVGDGVTAMSALWRGVAQNRPYPLALLDGYMPDIDGLALAAKIRQQTELSATRLILLTSGDRPGDRTRARQLGISATLLKPLQQRELMETILRVMGGEGDPEGLLVRPPVVRPTVPEGLGVPLRILVAEDNDFNRDLLEHMLARPGLSAPMTVNGREALALLEREPFDLLLLDIHMPELDGFQVIGAVRERERTAGGHLPVIALTARSQKEDRERCLRAGMDEYLAKPFTAAELWATIGRVLKSRPPYQPPRLDLLDPPVLLAACGGDPAMLRKMCRSLQSRVPEYLAAIRGALRDQDALRLREAAHKFSGMLSTFSTAAGDRAADLEDLAACGQLQEAIPVVEELDRYATELALLAGGLTVETLRKQAESADDPNRTAGS